MLFPLGLAALIGGVGAALTAPLMIGAGLLDTPSPPRKSHARPNPTSGGVAIGIGFALGLAGATLAPGPWRQAIGEQAVREMAYVSLFAVCALLMGLWDDYKPLTAREKSGAMIVLSLAVAVFVARADTLPIAGGHVLHLPLVLAILGSALWVFVMMNAVNFMDGANGLAMGSTAISLAALGLLGVLTGAPATALLAIAGAGAMAGFLVWNWPSGKLFAGDAGSLFAGVLAASAALVGVHEGGLSPFLMPVLFFPTLADVVLTFFWRMGKKRNLLEGHREHFYQIGVRAGLKSTHVTIWYWLATLGCASAGIAAAVFQRAVPGALADIEATGAVATALSVAALLASAASKTVLFVLLLAALQISAKVRAFSAARALEGQ